MSHMPATCGEPLYILKDHIAQEPITLPAKSHGKGGFTFSKQPIGGASGGVLFTADNKAGLSVPRRLIKDATGKVVLELWRNAIGDDSYIGYPSGPSQPLAVVAPRVTTLKDKVDVYVRGAGQENEETRLGIRGQDVWKRNTLVYHGDNLVMQLWFLKYITSFVPFSVNHWDVAVAQGFDLSLVSLADMKPRLTGFFTMLLFCRLASIPTIDPDRLTVP